MVRKWDSHRWESSQDKRHDGGEGKSLRTMYAKRMTPKGNPLGDGMGEPQENRPRVHSNSRQAHRSKQKRKEQISQNGGFTPPFPPRGNKGIRRLIHL